MQNNNYQRQGTLLSSPLPFELRLREAFAEVHTHSGPSECLPRDSSSPSRLQEYLLKVPLFLWILAGLD